MANAFYAKGREAFATKQIGWTTDTIKAILVQSGYTPDLTNHQYLSDLGANTVGLGVTLTTPTATGGVLKADNVSIGGIAAGNAVNYVAVYKDTGSSATSNLLMLFDTGTGLPVTTDGNLVDINWDVTNGLGTL